MVLPYDNMDYGVDEVGARNITELQDVELINLANEEILKYNSTSEKWENSLLVDNDTDNLADLTDTNITAPILNGSSLVYNTNTNKWQNLLLLDIDTLNNLSDTSLTSLTDKDFLIYDNASSKWINTPSNIDNLKNVNILSVANNEILKYNSTSSKWENSNLLINEINDVNITSLQNGEVLKYNSGSGKWENQDNTDRLSELSDVNFVILLNNFVLKYDITNNEWYGNFVNLTELGDTNISTLNNGDILRYNSVSQKWETDTFNIDDLDNVNFTSLTNGDLIKYDGSNFINFSPTYLDGAGISDNFLIKVVSGATTQTSITETNTINSTNITFNNGSIETEIFNTTKKRMHLTTDGIASTNGITITSDGRVGIGIVEPEEDFEVDGSIQIDSANVARLKFQKSGQNPHSLSEIDGEEDGNNGGDLQFYTKEDGGNVTEKLRINNVGAIGIGGANYGTTNQVLVSNDSGSSVSWANQTDTTYSNGTGVNLVGTTFSIGQSVATNDPVTFKNITLSRDTLSFPVEPVIFYNDPLNGGTLAQIQMSGDGLSAGKLQFYTKETGAGSLTEKLTIKENGDVGIGVAAPSYKLEVDGDIKGDNLFLGDDGTTPKIDLFFKNSSLFPGDIWKFRIEIGKSDDFINSPAFPPNDAYGMNVQANSDAFFVGIETYDGGNNWRPLLKWGDDADDTPFTIQSYSGNRIWEFRTDGTFSAQSFAPTYTSIPSLAGKIGQIVDAGHPTVTLVFNASIEVRRLTIPYTGVWLIGMSLYLGNIGNFGGQILFPTEIRINGSNTDNFYGTNLTGVNGTITRNLSVNDVVTFSTYLTGSGAGGLSASERGVWGVKFTFLTATRIA
jgi:hypothetical protein